MQPCQRAHPTHRIAAKDVVVRQAHGAGARHRPVPPRPQHAAGAAAAARASPSRPRRNRCSSGGRGGERSAAAGARDAGGQAALQQRGRGRRHAQQQVRGRAGAVCAVARWGKRQGRLWQPNRRGCWRSEQLRRANATPQARPPGLATHLWAQVSRWLPLRRRRQQSTSRRRRWLQPSAAARLWRCRWRLVGVGRGRAPAAACAAPSWAAPRPPAAITLRHARTCRLLWLRAPSCMACMAPRRSVLLGTRANKRRRGSVSAPWRARPPAAGPPRCSCC